MGELTPELLERCVRRHVAVRAGERLSFEPIASGHFNQSFYVTTDRHRLVLRVAPPTNTRLLFYERDMMRQEPTLHRLLRERTRVPVPEVVAFDETRQIIPRDFILMERLMGRPLSDSGAGNTPNLLRHLGQSLAQVHAITADRYGYLGEHRPMEPQGSWREAFRVMWNLLLDNVRTTGHYSAGEESFMRRLLDPYMDYFEGRGPARLLHMDVWAQNILEERGELTGLIDWDRALWGDPEIEFAVLDYCGISRPEFWQGYGAARDTSEGARIRRVFYLLYEVQKYIFIEHFRKGDEASAGVYKRESMRLARALTSS